MEAQILGRFDKLGRPILSSGQLCGGVGGGGHLHSSAFVSGILSEIKKNLNVK
jgi:hypothetical protein